MKVDIKLQPNPTYYVAIELSSKEIHQLEQWMSQGTDATAPNAYKELLGALRKAIG